VAVVAAVAEILKRERRLTFAGWEEACIQYQCDAYGYSGDMPTRENGA
jgi:hypothetical protein